jgi:hypothetical protein
MSHERALNEVTSLFRGERKPSVDSQLKAFGGKNLPSAPSTKDDNKSESGVGISSKGKGKVSPTDAHGSMVGTKSATDSGSLIGTLPSNVSGGHPEGSIPEAGKPL